MKFIIRFVCMVSPTRSDADPFKKIWVDPNDIFKATHGGPRTWGKVEGGDWDCEETFPFIERPPNQALTSWASTQNDCVLKESLKTASENTRNPRTGDGDIDQRIKEIKDLYQSLLNEGYREKKEGSPIECFKKWGKPNDRVPHSLDEIIVDIGRNGELIHRHCGQHRLRLSQILGIEEVVVLVGRRHRDWQQFRENIRSGAVQNVHSKEILSHPDLRDILSKSD